MALFRRSDRSERGRGRIEGDPTSSNGASSSHLWWQGTAAPAHAVAATLEVLIPPTVDRLYFWALQASFVGEGGRRYGSGHLGIQWHPRHPGSTAVNWGGYATGGGELSGTQSLLPSERDNPNTRDFDWVSGRRYRLQIEVGEAQGAWWGLVTDESTGEQTRVRQLLAGGTGLADPVVWAEVFARCDHPGVAVRWSDLVVGHDGAWSPVEAVRTSYQSAAAGGCDNTDITTDPPGWRQATATDRTVAPDTVLSL